MTNKTPENTIFDLEHDPGCASTDLYKYDSIFKKGEQIECKCDDEKQEFKILKGGEQILGKIESYIEGQKEELSTYLSELDKWETKLKQYKVNSLTLDITIKQFREFLYKIAFSRGYKFSSLVFELDDIIQALGTSTNFFPGEIENFRKAAAEYKQKQKKNLKNIKDADAKIKENKKKSSETKKGLGGLKQLKEGGFNQNAQLPLETGKITSLHLSFWDALNIESRKHQGIDIGATIGTSVPAIARGVVIERAYRDLWGKYILVDHGKDDNGRVVTLYAHLSHNEIVKNIGDCVAEGQKIGESGNTGYGGGCTVLPPHLHFAVYIKVTKLMTKNEKSCDESLGQVTYAEPNGQSVDPLKFDWSKVK